MNGKKRKYIERRHRRRNRRIKIGIIIVAMTMVLGLGIFYVIQQIFKSPIYDQVTVEAGGSLPTVIDFLVDKAISADDVTGIDDETIMTAVGEYPVAITIEGKVWDSKLCVKDTKSPSVVTKDVQTALNIPVNADAFIESIEDVTRCTVEYGSTPDVTTLGDKEVALIVIDEGGNSTQVKAKLTVIEDKEAPVIVCDNDIVVSVGGSISYKKNVTVRDNCDENVELKVDSSQVDVSQVGNYQVIYSAVDASGNETSKTVTVTVLSVDSPTLEMVNQLADNILADLVNDTMTEYQKAEAIYWWVHDNIGYVDHASKENWIEGAYRGLKERRGDCYTYATTAKALLTRAGIKNMDIGKIPDSATHYWNLIDVGEGWYHFDTTRRSDGTTFFYKTSEEIRSYSDAHYNSHNYDESKYLNLN